MTAVSLKYTLPQKKCRLPSSWKNSLLRFHRREMYANILRSWENHDQFWNEVFGKLLPWALSKWCITPDSLVYTLLQKKGNFRNVVFLLEKSVCNSVDTQDTDPGSDRVIWNPWILLRPVTWLSNLPVKYNVAHLKLSMWGQLRPPLVNCCTPFVRTWVQWHATILILRFQPEYGSRNVHVPVNKVCIGQPSSPGVLCLLKAYFRTSWANLRSPSLVRWSFWVYVSGPSLVRGPFWAYVRGLSKFKGS